MIRKNTIKSTPDKILKYACYELDVMMEDLIKYDGKDKYLAVARDIIIYFLVKYTLLPYSGIAQLLNIPSRQTPYVASKRIKRALKERSKHFEYIKTFCEKIEKRIDKM